MAEETRTKRLVDDNAADIAKYDALARKALEAGNEDDARTLLAKKQELDKHGANLQVAYEAAQVNANKMRQMHDKLVDDIEQLNGRREAIKAKVAVAKTQDKVNGFASSADKAAGTMSAFDRMEAKADAMLDRANAMDELNRQPVDEAAALEAKYANAGTDVAVEDELTRLKQEMGL